MLQQGHSEAPRPLMRAPVRFEDGAAIFTVGERSVRVEGDTDFLQRVLGRCDGALSAPEIATEVGESEEEVVGLLELLAAHGAVVEATEAYRLFHRESTTDAGLFRPIGSEELAALEAETFHPERAPLERVGLHAAGTRLAEIAARRRSAWARAERRPVSFPELSAIVSVAYGAGVDGHRPLPSAGGLYPLALHLAVRTPVGPLGPGLWWLEPAAGELALLRPGSPDLAGAFVAEPNAEAMLSRDGPVAFLSADLERCARKYANRAYRYVNMEVGAAMQSAYLAAAELGVDVRAIGGFSDRAVADLLGLGGRAEPLLALLLGA